MKLNTKGFARLMTGAIAMAGLVALSACGGPPSWVKEGSGSYKEGKAIYGVGAIQMNRNEPMAWDAAENLARADITKRFQTYTAYLMRNYAASTTAGDFTKSAEEQNVERAVKTFSSGTLTGVRRMDKYKDEDTSPPTYYVLVKMDFKDMQEALAQNQELNGQVREFVRKNAEALFQKLEKEEEKRGNK
jgi:hypothetical protein